MTAYYSCGCDSEQLFSGLKITEAEDFKTHLNQYHVIFLNMQEFLSQSGNMEQMISLIRRTVLWELLEEYPDFRYFDSENLMRTMQDVYRFTARPFVVIIDEWDCIFREYREDYKAQEVYLDFLRDMLKDKAYIYLAYMTGILPIKKYGTHSALNMFSEFSMINPRQLAEFVGFTEEEVSALCDRYGMDLQELRDDVLSMMAGEQVPVNTGSFSNDMTTFHTKDDVLTLLIHLGYLGYDFDHKCVFIPNHEIRGEFVNAVSVSEWGEVSKALRQSAGLLNAIWQKRPEQVAAGIELAHLETSHLQYNDENALSYTISLALYAARNFYTVIREMPSGKGFADMVYLPKKRFPEKPALVVELKWDKSAQGAIRQIREKKYCQSLTEYQGKLLLIGINYDKKTRVHSCEIEEWEK